MASSFLERKPRVLAAKLIPAPHVELFTALKFPSTDETSFALISCDLDHALFTALDQATKASPVNVVYTRSLYAGSAPSHSPLSGEAFGILSGADDQIVREGLKATIRALEQAPYRITEGTFSIPYFSHVISSLGFFLSKEAKLNPGDAIAYVMAPPVESVVALDAALKSSQVRLVRHFALPTETNFGGGYLSGELNECQAAAQAFSNALSLLAQQPIDTLDTFIYGRRNSTPQRPRS